MIPPLCLRVSFGQKTDAQHRIITYCNLNLEMSNCWEILCYRTSKKFVKMVLKSKHVIEKSRFVEISSRF
eukprot:UN25068